MNSPLTPTPRTDAEEFDYPPGIKAVTADFARTLERELRIAELKNQNSLANNLCPDHRDKLGINRRCLLCQIQELKGDESHDDKPPVNELTTLRTRISALADTRDYIYSSELRAILDGREVG